MSCSVYVRFRYSRHVRHSRHVFQQRAVRSQNDSHDNEEDDDDDDDNTNNNKPGGASQLTYPLWSQVTQSAAHTKSGAVSLYIVPAKPFDGERAEQRNIVTSLTSVLHAAGIVATPFPQRIL